MGRLNTSRVFPFRQKLQPCCRLTGIMVYCEGRFYRIGKTTCEPGDDIVIKRRIGSLIASILLLVAALLYWFRPWVYLEKPPAPPIVVESVTEPVVEPEQPRPAAIEFFGDPQTPIKIIINTETMNIEGDIVPVGLDSKGNMATTSEPFGVAWYRYSSSPGWPGNSILAGHNIYLGTPGTFADLYTLNPDDEVRFEYADGSTGYFLVKSNTTYLVKDIPASVMDLKGDARVTLIACAGENIPARGGFSHRVIVLLDPIEQ